eukprot:4247485-Prymnesium_polylepis.1
MSQWLGERGCHSGWERGCHSGWERGDVTVVGRCVTLPHLGGCLISPKHLGAYVLQMGQMIA